MRPRQLHQLAGMNRIGFIAAAARGLELIAEHVAQLEEAARQADATGSGRGGEVLRVVAEEEAGKYLILLDAVRIDWGDARRRADQLRRCHDHLANPPISVTDLAE